MFRRIFGSESDEITGEWSNLHDEQLNDLYSSPTIARVIKSRRVRWARHVARMGGGKRHVQGFGGVTLRERDHCGDPGVDGRIILRWIFRKWGVGIWAGLS
jgi:hypothetical protein